VQRTASGLFLLTRTVADGLRLYLTALLLHVFTGWSIPVAVLVMGVATIVYTYLGGMQAVIWTDLIQFVIYILGAMLAACFLLGDLPGGWDRLLELGRQDGKFQLLDFTADLTKPFTIWAGLLGGAVFTMASHGADQLMVQRYLCSRSLGQARLALVSSGVVVLVQFLLFLLIGVGLYALYWPRITAGEVPDKDRVFGDFIVSNLPPGLVGLVVAAVLAAAMSTLSSSLNSSANTFVTDLYRPLRPGHKEEDYLVLSRVMTAFWGVAQMAVALVALGLGSQRSVVEQVLTVAGFTTGMILGLFLLGSLRRPVGSSAALVGMIAGFLAVLAVWLPSVWGRPVLAWPWYAPVGAAGTVAVALLVNRMGTAHGPLANGGPQPGLDQPG
jgi:SSS family transporter